MKIEIIFPVYAMRKIHHYSSSGMKEIDVNVGKKDSIVPSFLAYVEKYVKENGFKLLNAESDKIYIYKE